MNKPSESNQEYRYKWYLDRVAEKRQWAEKLSESQDKLVFALSTGALILSVNFVDKIASFRNIEALSLLRTAWILLTLSAISVLVSLWAADASTLADKLLLDKWFKEGSMEAPSFPNTYTHRLTKITDILAKVALIIGIVLMAYFASLNIGSMDQPSNSDSGKSMPGFSSPLPPPQTPAPQPPTPTPIPQDNQSGNQGP